ncbi:MAG: hypothetical protein J6S83_02015 [Lachnospiraceae bacterium]|nr:hypothetical protein [Lachnospiraceae bacterium]
MTRSRIYLWMQTLACILLAVLLCAAAVSIFREGSARKAENPRESIYTREIAAEKLAPVAPLFFASVGLLIAGAMLGIKDENAGKPVRDPEPGRDLMVSRVPVPSDDMKKERRRQKNVRLAGLAVFALCMIPLALYLINPAHFPEQDLEGMFHGLLRVFIPWTAVGIGALAVTSVMREKSIVRETEAAKVRLKEEAAAADPGQAEQVKEAGQTTAGSHTTKTGHLKTVQVMTAVLALILIIAGIINLSARDVLYKAITICTECIGFG